MRPGAVEVACARHDVSAVDQHAATTAHAGQERRIAFCTAGCRSPAGLSAVERDPRMLRRLRTARANRMVEAWQRLARQAAHGGAYLVGRWRATNGGGSRSRVPHSLRCRVSRSGAGEPCKEEGRRRSRGVPAEQGRDRTERGSDAGSARFQSSRLRRLASNGGANTMLPSRAWTPFAAQGGVSTTVGRHTCWSSTTELAPAGASGAGVTVFKSRRGGRGHGAVLLTIALMRALC